MCIGYTWNDGVQSMRHPKKEKDLLPNGSIDELYCIRLCLLAHYFQVLLICLTGCLLASLQVIASFEDSSMAEEEDSDEALVERISKLWLLARPHDDLVDHKALIEKLKEATLSFLRPLALFYNAITMVTPPEALKGRLCIQTVKYVSVLCRSLPGPV